MTPEFERFVIDASRFFLDAELPHTYADMEEDDLMKAIAEDVKPDYSHMTDEQVYTEILWLAELLEETYKEGYDAGLEALNS